MNIDFYKEALEIFPEIQEIYHYLHQYPELSGEERNTQTWVMDLLKAWGMEVRACADTGIYSILRGEKKGHTVALRADMDALPIQEKTGLNYCSRKDGVMHACGHDAHMSVILGCIKLLLRYKDEISGNIVFLFQPSEEKDGGAKRMIKAGVLDDPKVDMIMAYHVWPQPVHTVTCSVGPVMAQPDAFRIDVKGKDGHGAAPHECKNPVSVLAAMIPAIERISGMVINANESSVVDVCRIHAGSRYNMVSDTGYLEGTIRTYHTEVRERIINELERIAKKLPEAYGMQGSYSMSSGYPATINDAETAMWAQEMIKKNFDKIELLPHRYPSMLGEDFSYYGQKIPALFMQLGIWGEKESDRFPLHHQKFHIQEEAIADGIAVLSLLAFEYSKLGIQKQEKIKQEE